MDTANHGTRTFAIGSRAWSFSPIGSMAGLLALVVVPVLAVVLVTGSMANSGIGAARTVDDRSYDQIEHARGALLVAPISIDDSYDRVEKARGQAAIPAGPADTSYDQIERLRGQTR